MAYEDVYCETCKAYLGMRSTPVLGIDPDFNGCKGKVYDPDCQKCNPHYDAICKNCGQQRLDKDGICTHCGGKSDTHESQAEASDTTTSNTRIGGSADASPKPDGFANSQDVSGNGIAGNGVSHEGE